MIPYKQSVTIVLSEYSTVSFHNPSSIKSISAILMANQTMLFDSLVWRIHQKRVTSSTWCQIQHGSSRTFFVSFIDFNAEATIWLIRVGIGQHLFRSKKSVCVYQFVNLSIHFKFKVQRSGMRMVIIFICIGFHYTDISLEREMRTIEKHILKILQPRRKLFSIE